MKLITGHDLTFDKNLGFIDHDKRIIYRCPGTSKIFSYKVNQPVTRIDKKPSDKSLVMREIISKLYKKEVQSKDHLTHQILKSIDPFLNEELTYFHNINIFAYKNFEKELGKNSPVINFTKSLCNTRKGLATVEWKAVNNLSKNLIDYVNLQILANHIIMEDFYKLLNIDYSIAVLCKISGDPAEIISLTSNEVNRNKADLLVKIKQYYLKNNWKGKYEYRL